MTKDEFLEKIIDILQTEENINFDTDLESLVEWDSLSAMGVMAFLNKDFGINSDLDDISKMKKIEDIAKKAGL